MIRPPHQHPDASAEIDALKRIGCTNAADLVDVAGVSRCRQVRAWIERLKRRSPVHNAAALASSLVMTNPNRRRRNG